MQLCVLARKLGLERNSPPARGRKLIDGRLEPGGRDGEEVVRSGRIRRRRRDGRGASLGGALREEDADERGDLLVAVVVGRAGRGDGDGRLEVLDRRPRAVQVGRQGRLCGQVL